MSGMGVEGRLNLFGYKHVRASECIELNALSIISAMSSNIEENITAHSIKKAQACSTVRPVENSTT